MFPGRPLIGDHPPPPRKCLVLRFVLNYPGRGADPGGEVAPGCHPQRCPRGLGSPNGFGAEIAPPKPRCVPGRWPGTLEGLGTSLGSVTSDDRPAMSPGPLLCTPKRGHPTVGRHRTGPRAGTLGWWRGDRCHSIGVSVVMWGEIPHCQGVCGSMGTGATLSAVCGHPGTGATPLRCLWSHGDRCRIVKVATVIWGQVPHCQGDRGCVGTGATCQGVLLAVPHQRGGRATSEAPGTRQDPGVTSPARSRSKTPQRCPQGPGEDKAGGTRPR